MKMLHKFLFMNKINKKAEQNFLRSKKSDKFFIEKG